MWLAALDPKQLSYGTVCSYELGERVDDTRTLRGSRHQHEKPGTQPMYPNAPHYEPAVVGSNNSNMPPQLPEFCTSTN